MDAFTFKRRNGRHFLGFAPTALKRLGQARLFYPHLSLLPLLPAMPLVYSRSRSAQRKLPKYAQRRSERKAQDTVKQNENHRVRDEISEFIILGLSKIKPS